MQLAESIKEQTYHWQRHCRTSPMQTTEEQATHKNNICVVLLSHVVRCMKMKRLHAHWKIKMGTPPCLGFFLGTFFSLATFGAHSHPQRPAPTKGTYVYTYIYIPIYIDCLELSPANHGMVSFQHFLHLLHHLAMHDHGSMQHHNCRGIWPVRWDLTQCISKKTISWLRKPCLIHAAHAPTLSKTGRLSAKGTCKVVFLRLRECHYHLQA